MTDDTRAAGESRFHALAESSPAGIYIARERRISYVNPALAALAECERGALLGLDPLDLLHISEREAAAARRTARDGTAIAETRQEVRLHTRSGLDRWVDLITAPFPHDGDGSIIGTAVDVTERRMLDDRMKRQQQLEAVGRLAGGVAHDFNNLLLVITGEAERLLDGLAPGNPLRASAEAVSTAAERAAALTQHLLAFGRQQMLIARPVNVNDAVLEVEAALWRTLGPNVTTRTDLAPNLPAVRVDRTRLEQVLISLVSNIQEALVDGGSVTIATDLVQVDDEMRVDRPWLTGGWWVRLRVTDTGPGIAADILPRVFEPFFTTKRAGMGSGLGLSTVYGIVKQSGGFVWIESDPGVRTTVTILLPPAETVTVEAPEPAQKPKARPHVLLVEDQDGVRELLTTVLRKHGFEVSPASSAEEALEIVAGLSFDLLLTDVVLPGITGPELARKVREVRPLARVLFMSGYTGDALQDHGEFGDERAFIQKPFATRALVERLHLLLESTA